jgi:hypothetical protein
MFYLVNLQLLTTHYLFSVARGDGGIDIISFYKDHNLIIQYKNHERPIGNYYLLLNIYFNYLL